VPDGDPVQDYFPTIIDEQLFYRYRTPAAPADKRCWSKGVGHQQPVLWPGHVRLLRVAHGVQRKQGPGPKGGSYIVCDAAGRGLGCEKVLWRYDAFEKSFLAFVRELDLESIVHGEDEARKRSILESTITALRGERAAINEQMERTYELINIAGNATSFVAEKLQALEGRRAAVEAELRERSRSARGSGLPGAWARSRSGRSSSRSKVARGRALQTAIADCISIEIARLDDTVAPLGHAPLVKRTVDFLSGETGVEPVIEHLRSTMDDRRYFSVGFVDGTTRTRIVWPNRMTL